jgi:hypothetical protein
MSPNLQKEKNVTMVRRMFLTAMLLLPSSMLHAHGTGQHVLGTVTAIDGTHIEVKTTKGATVSVNVTKDTRFKEKGKPKSKEQPVVGDRVVIEATKDDKTLTATEVHFSAGKRQDPPAAPSDAPPAAP